MPLEKPPEPRNADFSCDSVLASPAQPPAAGQLMRVTYWSGSSPDDGSASGVHVVPSLVVWITGSWLASTGASATEQSRPSGQLTDVMVRPCQAAGMAGCCQVTPPSEVIATPEPPAYRQCRASPHDIRKPGTELDFGGTLSVWETDQVRPWSAERMTTAPGRFPGTDPGPSAADGAPPAHRWGGGPPRSSSGRRWSWTGTPPASARR